MIVFIAVFILSLLLVIRKVFLKKNLEVVPKLINFFFFGRLKPIDVIVLKKLVQVVNVVPVIAKADSLTMEERAAFKKRVRRNKE